MPTVIEKNSLNCITLIQATNCLLRLYKARKKTKQNKTNKQANKKIAGCESRENHTWGTCSRKARKVWRVAAEHPANSDAVPEEKQSRISWIPERREPQKRDKRHAWGKYRSQEKDRERRLAFEDKRESG